MSGFAPVNAVKRFVSRLSSQPGTTLPIRHMLRCGNATRRRIINLPGEIKDSCQRILTGGFCPFGISDVYLRPFICSVHSARAALIRSGF